MEILTLKSTCLILHVDTSSSALKPNLASLKTEINKLDINKLVPDPVHLNNLSDVLKKWCC